MAAETLKRASVQLHVTSGKGSRISAHYTSHAAGASKPATPAEAMTAAADEIARIAELCGFGDAVEAAVIDARKRVQDHQGAHP